MANWLMELTKIAKADPKAGELLKQLKSATTDEEKQKAKEDGKAYIESKENTKKETVQASDTGIDTSKETESVEESVDEHKDDSVVISVAPVHVVKKEVDKKYDMSEPAFNPRLAKMGITREEELFQMGVYVRKLTREEKFEIRRSIYQKKKLHMREVQNRFKEERIKKMAALQADPEYQKYQNQQKLVIRIEEALANHCNIEWMFNNIEGLNADVMRELLQNPANVNKFKEKKDTFVSNFYKKFGK